MGPTNTFRSDMEPGVACGVVSRSVVKENKNEKERRNCSKIIVLLVFYSLFIIWLIINKRITWVGWNSVWMRDDDVAKNRGSLQHGIIDGERPERV